MYPQDLHSEKVLLGRMLSSKSALNLGIDLLKDVDFFDPIHAAIFSSFMIAFRENVAIEPLTISSILQKNFPKCADTAYLQGLRKYALTDSDEVMHFINEIKKNSQLRQLTFAGQDLTEKSLKSKDPIALLSEHNQKTEQIFLSSPTKDEIGLAEEVDNNFFDSNMSLEEYFKSQAEKYKAGINTYQGIPSGFDRLDNALSGLCKGHFIALGARPGVGKTLFVLNLIHNLTNRGVKVGFFSLEMTRSEIVNKLSSIRSGIDSKFLGRGLGTPNQIKSFVEASKCVKTLPLIIDANSALPISQILARSKRWIVTHNIEILFIDYLGLIRAEGKFSTKQEETQSISTALCNLAKNLRIPIVCVCQLNRESETLKRLPKKCDLRDSGQIEQDAHSILLLHREQDDHSGKTAVIIDKNRFGPHTTIYFSLEGHIGRFKQLDFTPPNELNL